MTLIEAITRDIRELPNAKLVEVARFVREIAPEVALRQREGLAASYGIMDDEEGEAFEAAVLGEDRETPAAD